MIQATIRRGAHAVELTWTAARGVVVRGEPAAAGLRHDVDAWFTPGHTVWYNPRKGGTYAGFDWRDPVEVSDGLDALARHGFTMDVTQRDVPRGPAPARWLTPDGRDWLDEGTVLEAAGPVWARRYEYRDPKTGRMIRPRVGELGKATSTRARAVALLKVMGQQLGLFGGQQVVHVKEHVARNRRTGAAHVVRAHDQHRAAAAPATPAPQHTPAPVPPPPPARRAHPDELGPDDDLDAAARDLIKGGDIEGTHRHYSAELQRAHEELQKWDLDFAYDRINEPKMRARLDALEASLLPPMQEPAGTVIGGVRILGTADSIRMGARDLLATSFRWRRELFNQPRREAKDIMRRHSKGLHVDGQGTARVFSGGRERFHVYNDWDYRSRRGLEKTDLAVQASLAAQLRDLAALPESHQHVFRRSRTSTRVLARNEAMQSEGLDTAAVASVDDQRRPQVRLYFGAFVNWADPATAERGATLIHELGHVLSTALTPPPLDDDLLALLGPQAVERARNRSWEDDDHDHRMWTQSPQEWLAEAYRVAYAADQMDMKTTLKRSDLDFARFRDMIESRIAKKHGAELRKATHTRPPAARTLAILLKAFAQQVGLFAPRSPSPAVAPTHPEGPGWIPIPGSHRGGYHRVKSQGGFDYWYPDTGETSHPHPSDAHLVPATPSPMAGARPSPKHVLQYLHRTMAGVTAYSLQGAVANMRARLLRADGADGGLTSAAGRHVAEIAVEAVLTVANPDRYPRAGTRLQEMNAHELIELLARLGAHAASKDEAIRQLRALYDAPPSEGRHPDDVFPRQVGPIGRGMALADVEQAIENLDEEHVAIFAPDGRQLARLGPDSTRAWSDSDPGATCYVPASAMASAKRNRDAVFTHNHPNGSPPSPEDVRMVAMIGAAQLRVVARGRGGAWVIDRPDIGWDEILGVMHKLNQTASREAVNRCTAHILKAGGDPRDGNRAKGYDEALWRRMMTEEWINACTSPAAAALGLRFERRGPDPARREPEPAIPADPAPAPAVEAPRPVEPSPAAAEPADGWHDWTPELDAQADAQGLNVEQRLGPSSWLVKREARGGYRQSWAVMHADGRITHEGQSADGVARAGRGHRAEHGTRQPLRGPALRPHLKEAGVQLAPRNSLDGPGLSIRQVDKHRVAVVLPHGWYWDAQKDEAVKRDGERNLERAAAALEAKGYRVTMGAAASGFHADRLVPVPTGPRSALRDPSRELLAEVLKRQPSEDEHRGYRVGWADVRADRTRPVRDTPGFGSGYHTGRALAQNVLGGEPEALRLLARHDPATVAALRAQQVAPAAKARLRARGLIALFSALARRST